MIASDFVARELKIKLPEDYANFLNTTGYLCFSNLGIEVYGYKPEFDIQKIPCVIAATNLNKSNYHLNSSEIVISHTGFEELITILDCNTGKIYEVGFNGLKNEIADSFKTWLKLMTKKNDAIN